MHICKYCSFKCRHLKFLLRHYSEEHASDPNFYITCGIGSCLSSYNQINSFRKHILRKHKQINIVNRERDTEQNMLTDDNGLENNIDLGEYSDIEMQGDCELGVNQISVSGSATVNASENCSGLKENIKRFLLNLRVKHYVSEKTSALIMNKFNELILNCHEKTTEILSECDISSVNINKITLPFNDLLNTTESLNSVYLQNQTLKEHPYVPPVQINIDNTNNIVYIPILETLKSLLSHEDILSFITKSPSNTTNTVSDFTCGQKYKSNIFFSLPNTIQILLYIDDFTLTNPLGTTARKNKLCALYFTLGNLPYNLRSKLYTIQLISLFPSFILKQHGFEVVLEKLVQDLKILETEGLSIESPIGPVQFHGSISAVIADNLAAHEIGGYITSFSSFRCCRFCNTIESYNTQVEHVKENPNLSKVYGIKNSSVLNKLSHFHICWNSPSDIAHDLFEGVCLDLLTVIIEHCLSEKYFSLHYINNKIKTFPYCGKDSVNKPSQILSLNNSAYKIKIKQTAAECHNLVSLLPLFVADKIPDTDPYWQCFLLFLNCLDFILAPALNLGQINH